MPRPPRWLAGVLLALLAITASSRGEAAGLVESWKMLPKEDKALYFNLGAGAAVIAWGVVKWDYFANSPRSTPEGWFGRNTSKGGADKLGHLWTAYAASHGFGVLYRHWGYEEREAGKLGALTSLGLTTLMEVGDSMSGKYGFSYEDAIMNTAGAGIGYLLWREPELARWIDLRVEWRPHSGASDIFTDYDHLKYLVALKLEAVASLRTTPLRFMELQAGYYVRGYSRSDPDRRQRNLYVGIGVNVSQLVKEAGLPRIARVFNYLQVPYTYVSVRKDLND